jgi:pimeloyl-ACP methyl ester carboxylesterase
MRDQDVAMRDWQPVTSERGVPFVDRQLVIRIRRAYATREMTVYSLLQRLGRRALRFRGFETRSVDTPLGPVFAYEARGAGKLPPVVFLHGLSSSATSFAPLLTKLLPHVRSVIAPDMPGHGFSGQATGAVTQEALFEAMTSALDKLFVDKTVVVGNSLGGAVALRHAIARPDKVAGLVLFSPGGARCTEDELRTVVSLFHLKNRADALEFAGRVFHEVPPIFKLLAHELPRVMSEMRAVPELLGSVTTDGMMPDGALAGLRMPILFVWGKSERLLPPSGLAWYRKDLPAHAVFEEPVGVGHVPPPEVADRIVRFLRSCS